MSLVVHFEIHASDPERSIAFYSQLLGWRFEQYGDAPYWTIDTGRGAVHAGPTGAVVPGVGINGGLQRREGPAPAEGAPVAGANIVVGVDDADAVHARGVELGGRSASDPEDMPGIGRIAYLLDPDSNLFGVISDRLSDGTSAMPPVADASIDPMQVTPEP
jgi:uncharacterized protein